MKGFNKFQKLIGISYLVVIIFAGTSTTSAQPAPALDENIPYLVTFGSNADPSWGDDDFCQVFFCIIPENVTRPVYLRVFDPDTGGELDEVKGEFDTRIRFSLYGGKGCWTEEDAKAVNPTGNYKSGQLLFTKIFSSDEKYDQNWYSFGPINPREGEYVDKFKGYIVKVIAEGISGDDGNLYRYFLSTNSKTNQAIEGGNIFTYEYTFRLANNINHISQIYPFIDNETISIEISNFDWDNDGLIRIISVAKNGVICDVSRENNWIKREFQVVEQEKNTSIEVQFIKKQSSLIKNNNVAVVVKNQYGETLPFFVIPIGGVPVYTPKIMIRSAN
jgi:hypothetical protein